MKGLFDIIKVAILVKFGGLIDKFSFVKESSLCKKLTQDIKLYFFKTLATLYV